MLLSLTILTLTDTPKKTYRKLLTFINILPSLFMYYLTIRNYQTLAVGASSRITRHNLLSSKLNFSTMFAKFGGSLQQRFNITPINERDNIMSTKKTDVVKQKQGVVTRDVYDRAMSTYQTMAKDGVISQDAAQSLIDKYASDHRVKGTRAQSNLAVISDLKNTQRDMQTISELVTKVNKQLAKDRVRMNKRNSEKQGLPQLGLKVEIMV